jgi:nitrogen regulatory protein P-II 2
METVRVKLLTVIAESFLEERLIGLLRRCGARGYTVAEVRGEGSRGVRASEWEGKNVRLESLLSNEAAARVLAALEREFFAHYAVVAYTQEVEVVRGDKYV